MLANYEHYRFAIGAKTMPESCAVCPFWEVNANTFENGGCIITGHEILLDGKQDKERMRDCPIILEE